MERNGRKCALAAALLFISTAALGGSGGALPALNSISFREDFESASLAPWLLPFPEDWEILAEGGNHYLHLKRGREPGVPRRPLQFALLKNANVGNFDFRVRLRREGRSMIVVFNYVDTLHFYYTHLSADRGTEQPVHNGVFLVDGEPRRRIAGLEAHPALPDRAWHEVRIKRDVARGTIDIFTDGLSTPLFSAVDRSFNCGQVGLGSFDETGDFDDVELHSNDAGCVPGSLLRPAKSDEVK